MGSLARGFEPIRALFQLPPNAMFGPDREATTFCAVITEKPVTCESLASEGRYNGSLDLRSLDCPPMVMRFSLAAAFCLSMVGPGWAQPVNTLRDLVPALMRCWRAPNGTAGSELTLAIALKRDGELLGRPSITHSKLTGDAEAQGRFVSSVLMSLARCTPVSITHELGEAVAGRRFVIRFRSKPRHRRV